MNQKLQDVYLTYPGQTFTKAVITKGIDNSLRLHGCTSFISFNLALQHLYNLADTDNHPKRRVNRNNEICADSKKTREKNFEQEQDQEQRWLEHSATGEC
jgi:hypothetical protein